MKSIVAVALLALGIGMGGFWMGEGNTPQAVAQDKPAKPEKIKNLEQHLKEDKDYEVADFAGKLTIVGELQKAQRTDWTTARGLQMRLVLAHARANELDPETNLVAFVQWMGAQLKDWKGEINKACGSTGSLTALMETYGARRLYRDEAFLKGDAEGKLRRIKELWEARELDQSQCYDLTRMYVYEHLSAAGGDIDKQIEMFGKLERAKAMDWAGSSSVHEALMTRAMDEKKDLDTVEKKLIWLTKKTDSSTGDLSWMTVGQRRITLFMHVVDADMAGLDTAARKAKIKEWVDKGALTSSDVRDLEATYCIVE